MAKRQHNGPARDRRQLLELLAVHAVIIAVLLALTGIVLHKAFTPVTAENPTRQVVAFDRWERERHGKRAGLRTHMIIAASSALMMILSKYGFADVMDTMRVDASRIAAGVITSIGFLGIGIIRADHKETVGLTTSAGLLATVAIGLTVGAGMYIVAGFTTVLIVLLEHFPHKEN